MTAALPQLRERLSNLRRRIRKWRVDALLVTNRRDIHYLTNFTGEDSWALIPAGASRPIVLSDFRFEEEIDRVAPQVEAVIRKGAMTEALANLLKRKRIRRVALQQDHVTVAQRAAIAKRLGASRLKDVDDGLIDQRAVKDSGEVRKIEQALAIQQEALRRTLRFIKPGKTESEIAAYLEYQMRSLGADGRSFPTIVAADANASLPHAVPGSTKVKRGGIVLIDWGARYGGYCSDLTRVVAIGRMPAKIREVYKIVLDAQLAAIDAIKPGMRLKDVDAAARGVIEKAGYGERFGHGTGHGIGLDIHEQPVLSPRVPKGVLEPGHVVTVEPGIYLPGFGGVRIEDDVLVTRTGKRVLSNLPKTLESAII